MLQAEKLARSSKVSRMIHSPIAYPLLMGFNKIIYPFSKQGFLTSADTFFGRSFKTLLPSGTDVILNGMKAHDSEIRLAKFLVYYLTEKDTFIDVGAHYGYYALLASALVGDEGRVHAIEASAESYLLLKENTFPFKNIHSYKNAASDTLGEITFYEYPGPHSEYNTTVKDAYINTPWIKKVKETVNKINTILLDDLLTSNQISKAVIKIDAEGGELAVLKGLSASLQEKDLTVIMEYLLSDDSSSLHHQAVKLFNEHGYRAHAIQADGSLIALDDIDRYLSDLNLDSDNLVFKRKTLDF